MTKTVETKQKAPLSIPSHLRRIVGDVKYTINTMTQRVVAVGIRKYFLDLPFAATGRSAGVVEDYTNAIEKKDQEEDNRRGFGRTFNDEEEDYTDAIEKKDQEEDNRRGFGRTFNDEEYDRNS